jgi:hypothetical protein
MRNSWWWATKPELRHIEKGQDQESREVKSDREEGRGCESQMVGEKKGGCVCVCVCVSQKRNQ